jgi:hypothetical protein
LRLGAPSDFSCYVVFLIMRHLAILTASITRLPIGMVLAAGHASVAASTADTHREKLSSTSARRCGAPGMEAATVTAREEPIIVRRPAGAVAIRDAKFQLRSRSSPQQMTTG